jgi:hypothetical protein
MALESAINDQYDTLMEMFLDDVDKAMNALPVEPAKRKRKEKEVAQNNAAVKVKTLAMVF